MTQEIPVIDLEAALGGRPPAGVLDAVRAAAEQIGIVQVVNHGIDADLIDEFSRRTGELLALPRAEKAKLASPHPYRGWRQWPDDFGRLELERYNVAQFDTPQAAKAAGVREEYLGLFADQNVWPDAQLREVAFGYMDASRRLAERMLELYAQAEDVPAATFSLGSLPHLRLTVNDYPTWSYPDAEGDQEVQGAPVDMRAPVARMTPTAATAPDAPHASGAAKLLLLEHADDSAVTVLSQAGDYRGCRRRCPTAAGGRCRSSRARCKFSPGCC